MLTIPHQQSPRIALFLSAVFLTCLSLASALAPAALAQEFIKVEVVEIQERELMEEIPLTGTVSSPQISLLSTEVEGLISNLGVDAGDRVKAGDLLLQLDTELSEIDFASARASANGARANWENSKRRLSEAKTLIEQNNIAASEVRGFEAQVSIDAATFEAADADSRRAEAELKRHSIRAPFDGTISRKLAEVGEWLSPGSQVLELVATDKLRIDFQIPQRFYPRINENTRLALSFDGYPGQNFVARVQRTVPLSSSSARTFLLRAQLDDTPDTETAPLIIPGMSANAVLKLSVDGNGITAPRDALLRYPDGRVSIWVINNYNATDKTAEVHEQQVTPGLAFGEQIEIRSGLEAGQQVVTRGNEALRAGQKVLIETFVQTPTKN
jgi:RND family efflux transporter MFP subunit